MKKTLLLILMVIIALIIDGMLTYDIFDFREETEGGWLLFLLGVFLLSVIILVDSPTNDVDKDNPE
ncbi:MAG: hypothetical protein G3M70_09165 [Candidatus Nitronauta litoralis]|uniref:Uncharacterized protein n=1 Tax=Candidatus Nitronauta litoralis TaxID=2705533 RepID=A0A7T0BWZ3_9BACT|nr:MAG: hypothetical protein G3M70_09165 [Candidatus Nitronauta litoralis]